MPTYDSEEKYAYMRSLSHLRSLALRANVFLVLPMKDSNLHTTSQRLTFRFRWDTYSGVSLLRNSENRIGGQTHYRTLPVIRRTDLFT